jgi:rRNA-processing protein FCF1
MKLLMDSDCLIKLAKSSLKEIVCQSFAVTIPPIVKKEIVEDSTEQPDAMVIKQNLEKKLLVLSKQEQTASKGEEAVFTVFQSGRYDAICSDDRRFIKRLRLFQVPFLTPAVLIAVLLRKGKITLQEALRKLDSLSPVISEEEYGTVKAALANWRKE